MKKSIKYVFIICACFCLILTKVNASTKELKISDSPLLFNVNNKSVPTDRLLLLADSKNMSKFNFCDKKGVLQLLRISGTLKNIIKILVPVLLVIVVTIDLGIAFISGDDKDIAAKKDTIIRRLIAAVLVFLIPTVIDAILKQVSTYNSGDYYNTNGNGEFGKCTLCFASPSKSNCDDKAVS